MRFTKSNNKCAQCGELMDQHSHPGSETRFTGQKMFRAVVVGLVDSEITVVTFPHSQTTCGEK